ncbi:MAG TPA: hypothetical protein GXX36_11610 [Clostridiaceae bacterium]|nr:hypothetical protein [Clostridiaceae bacterium]
MKFGIRKPSIRKSIAARTSVKRYMRHNMGFKAPRGWGWAFDRQHLHCCIPCRSWQ